MIQEAFVNFETAKLLKSKGFEEWCEHYYYEDGKLVNPYDSRYAVPNCKVVCTGPTQQMAMRWLREEKEIAIVIKPYPAVDGLCYIFIIEKLISKDSTLINRKESAAFGAGYDSYEDAVEGAIKYCLTELI